MICLENAIMSELEDCVLYLFQKQKIEGYMFDCTSVEKITVVMMENNDMLSSGSLDRQILQHEILINMKETKKVALDASFKKH